MKTILTTMVLAAVPAIVLHAAPEPTLKPGSEVKLESVTGAKWIQGEAPKAFEPGKIYIFECWATWCGPCVAAIPHVNGLYKKYHEKGLMVYGMNVWEDGQEKVEKFVKGKGDGMSYPVAYTGKGSAFETDWLKAAGVSGIPHAFIVKDGKLLLTSHPAQLTDEVIEALLSGEDAGKKAADALAASSAAQQKQTSVLFEFQRAAAANDTETMAAKLAEMEKNHPDSPNLAMMKLDLLIVRKDFPAALKAIDELPAGMTREMLIARTATRIELSKGDSYPVEFVKAVTKHYAALAESPQTSKITMIHTYLTLCALQWKSGDKQAAIASAKKVVEYAKSPDQYDYTPSGPVPAKNLEPSAAPYERFAKSVEEGTLPTRGELHDWLLEESKSENRKPAE